MDAKRAADARHCDRILAAPSFYDVLEVSRSADEAHVRKCYLKVSLRVHPDRNADPRAKAAFQRVAEAYETLAGPGRRAYDAARRPAGVRGWAAAAPGAGAAPGAAAPPGRGAFDMDAAMRIFAAAAAAAEAAAAESAGVPEYVRLATALLDVAPDAEGAALLTGFVGGAVAVANLLPASWRQKAAASVAPERAATTVAAVGAAALFGLTLLNAAAATRPPPAGDKRQTDL